MKLRQPNGFYTRHATYPSDVSVNGTKVTKDDVEPKYLCQNGSCCSPPPLVFVLCQFQQFIVLIPVPVAGRSLRASTETPTYRHYDETCDLATTLRPLAFFLSGLSLCRGSR